MANLFNSPKSILFLCAVCICGTTATIVFAASKDAGDNDDDAQPKTSLVNMPESARDANLNGNISIEENMRLRRDLYEYSKAVDPAHVQIEERRRVMHQRLQARFQEADKDNDGTISRIEAFEMMPQIARHFSEVDSNNDNMITLEELEAAQARYAERQRATEEKPPQVVSPVIKTSNAPVAATKRSY